MLTGPVGLFGWTFHYDLTNLVDYERKEMIIAQIGNIIGKKINCLQTVQPETF